MGNIKHRTTTTADPALIEMARSYGLSGWPLFRDVTLPAALPSILRAVRIGLWLAWLLLIVTAAVSAQSVARISLYVLLGILADLLVRATARHLLSWHPAYR